MKLVNASKCSFSFIKECSCCLLMFAGNKVADADAVAGDYDDDDAVG